MKYPLTYAIVSCFCNHMNIILLKDGITCSSGIELYLALEKKDGVSALLRAVDWRFEEIRNGVPPLREENSKSDAAWAPPVHEMAAVMNLL